MSGKRAASHIFKVLFCHTRRGRHTPGFPGATCPSPLLPHQSCCQCTWQTHGLRPPGCSAPGCLVSPWPYPNGKLTTSCIQGHCTYSRDGETNRGAWCYYRLQCSMSFCLAYLLGPGCHREKIGVRFSNFPPPPDDTSPNI